MPAREEVYQEAGWFAGYGETAELVAVTEILIIFYGNGHRVIPVCLG